MLATLAFIAGAQIFGAVVVTCSAMMAAFPSSIRGTGAGIGFGAAFGPDAGGLLLGSEASAALTCAVIADA